MVDFLKGLIVGAAVGAGVVVALTPRSGEQTRQWLKQKIDASLEVGRHVAETHEQELWEAFHTKLKEPPAQPHTQNGHGGMWQQVPPSDPSSGRTQPSDTAAPSEQ